MRTFKYIGIAILAAALSTGLPSPAKVAAQPGFSVSFQAFFNSLSPFGRWSNHPQYGSVWAPSVNRDFHPYYTNGRWVMTEYGNTWVSDYEWGWAPFHYGRWFYDDYLGWAWVPDYTWGPGWVNWRTGGGYYGWAPLMPGIDIRLSINLPFNFWTFIPHRHFMSARWHRYSVPRTRVTNVYHQTTIINNYYTYNNHEYAYGPRSSDIQRHTKSQVPVYTYSSRGNNGQYRESVARTSNAGARQAVEIRERNFDNGVTVATPGSGRTPAAATSNNRNSSSGRTGTPETVSPRSSDPIASPETGVRTRGRNTSPATRNPDPERNTPAAGSSRTREAVAPREGSSIRTNSRTPASRNENAVPANGSRARSRETVSPGRSSSPAPATRSTSPERTAPAAGSSSSRESASPVRSAPAPERVSPARSASPSGSPTPARSTGRSSTSERSGRQQ